jgi:hypothetical protein
MYCFYGRIYNINNKFLSDGLSRYRIIQIMNKIDIYNDNKGKYVKVVSLCKPRFILLVRIVIVNYKIMNHGICQSLGNKTTF